MTASRMMPLPLPVLTARLDHRVSFRWPVARPRSESVQQLAGDDQLLDLARSLVQTEETRVAVEALDGDFLHVAGTAVDLHAAVGDAVDHLRGEELGGG